MLTLLGLLAPLGVLPQDRWFGGIALGVALAFIVAGLLSSTFHLGHPERAWRALTQWRSSWLSREGVLALLTFIPAGLFGLGWVVLGKLDDWSVWGYLAAALAMVTVYSTSMIYASLKTIRHWNNRLVPVGYLVLGVMTGAVFLVAVTTFYGAQSNLLVLLALVSLLIATLVKLKYWTAVDNEPEKSDAGTATGLGSIGRVRAFEAPHTSDNWVMKEMGYRIGRKHAGKLRNIALLLGFVVPALCLIAILATGSSVLLALVAVLSAAVGVVAERWLFFAEAKHVVGLYYGR